MTKRNPLTTQLEAEIAERIEFGQVFTALDFKDLSAETSGRISSALTSLVARKVIETVGYQRNPNGGSDYRTYRRSTAVPEPKRDYVAEMIERRNIAEEASLALHHTLDRITRRQFDHKKTRAGATA